MHKVVTDKNGRMRTKDVAPPPSAEALEKLRREVRDIVAGNTPFHVDPNAAPKAVEDLPTVYDDPDWCAFGGGTVRVALPRRYLTGDWNA